MPDVQPQAYSASVTLWLNHGPKLMFLVGFNRPELSNTKVDQKGSSQRQQGVYLLQSKLSLL